MRLCAAFLLAAGAAAAGDRDPAPFTVVDGAEIVTPLAEEGDPSRGAALAADPDAGGCLACHAAGRDAPALDGLSRRRSVGRLRLALVDLALVAPKIDGHAFYTLPEETDGPEPPETPLSAQEIEDVLAWLKGF